MSKQADITIEFDKKDRVFTAGSVVSGKVTVSPLESIECRDIVVSIFWSTHGKGNRDKKELNTLASGPQRLIAGKDIVIPFSFQLPCAPLTYHGTYVNVDYYVKAKIDLALKLDPSVEKDFLVLPGASYSPSGASTRNTAQNKNSTKSSLIGWVISIVILTLLTVLFLHFWFVFLVVLLIVSYRPIMNSYAAKKTGKITVDAGNRIIYPGKKLPLSISFTPNADLNCNCVKISLNADESAVSGSGTNKTTHHHNIVSDNFDLPFEKYIRKGTDVKHQIDITIPDIAAYSFDSSNNGVSWNVAIHIGIDKWPDWKEKIILVMCPDVKRIEISG
jgi:hypothetical protein